MKYLARSYEKDGTYKREGEEVQLHTLHLEVMALEEEDNEIKDGPGYYFRGSFVEWTETDGTKEVAAQVSGEFARKNYSEQSGWTWGYHNGKLSKMAKLAQGLEGFKPISDEHYEILKANIEALEKIAE